jgi:hypothetical protein
MQRGMVADLGPGFDASHSEGARSSEIAVRRCLYNDILQDEGKPHLLGVCCCSQDASWCALRHDYRVACPDVW